LLATGATIAAYDPVAMNEAKHRLSNEPRITFADNQTAALEGADALIVVTECRD
jgi:UDPglucose 6-dehydrogenase